MGMLFRRRSWSDILDKRKVCSRQRYYSGEGDAIICRGRNDVKVGVHAG